MEQHVDVQGYEPDADGGQYDEQYDPHAAQQTYGQQPPVDAQHYDPAQLQEQAALAGQQDPISALLAAGAAVDDPNAAGIDGHVSPADCCVQTQFMYELDWPAASTEGLTCACICHRVGTLRRTTASKSASSASERSPLPTSTRRTATLTSSATSARDAARPARSRSAFDLHPEAQMSCC